MIKVISRTIFLTLAVANLVMYIKTGSTNSLINIWGNLIVSYLI